MKKFCVTIFFLIILVFAAWGAPESPFDALYKSRREELKRMQQEVIDGKFPVYIDVTCEDKATSNKLKSLMTSALRKKDNVKIVANRNDAWFWMYVLAIKQTSKQVAISIAFGNDEYAFLQKDLDRVWSIGSVDIFNESGFTIYSWTYDKLGELTSEVADKFDVKILEPARQSRDWFLSNTKGK